MSASVLVISNYRNSSMSYISSLRGYGFDVEDIRTFEAARILLRSGMYPHAIVVDVKFHLNEIANFIQFIRSEFGATMGIIIVGYENETLLAYGADACLERPVDFQDIMHVFESVQ